MKEQWMKFTRFKITPHVLLLALSGLCSITLVNILFPLAMYSKYAKVAAVLISFLLTSGFVYFLYFRFFQSILAELRTHWLRNVLISAALTVFLLSLSPLHLPYHPVEHTIKISTNSPDLGFIHIVRHIKTGPPQLVEDVDYVFSGDWEQIGDVTVHQGEQTGEIDYQKVEFVRESLIYHVSFQRQQQTSEAVITIDGESYPVEIEVEEQDNSPALFKFEVPSKASASRFWQLWITIFPFFSALTLFTFVFCGVGFLFSRKQAWPERSLSLALFTMLLYLFWITLGYQNDLVNHWAFHLLMPIAALVFFVLGPFGLVKLIKKVPHRRLIFLLVIILIGVALRVHWIMMVPSAQVSDFGRFHQWALQLASGEPGLLIDRYASFTRMLSLLYRVFPSHQVVEVLNILFSVGTMLCLYWIGKVNQQETAGLLAAYFFAVFPAQISMVTIVNTDIPSVFLLTLSVYGLICFSKRERWWCLLFSAAAFGVAYVIRGALLIYLPVLLIPLFVNQSRPLMGKLIRVGVLLAGFALTVIVLTGLLGFVQIEDLVIDEGRNMIWPLVNGTNIAQSGRNNPVDEALIFSWSPQEANKEGLKVVVDRVFSDPIAYYQFLKVKYEFMFADATYGANLAFFDETHEYFKFKTGWKYSIDDVREGFAQFSQYAYLAVLLVGVLASLKVDGSHWKMTLPIAVVLLCAFGAYAFFEVQPRYSRPIIPFVILMAGLLFAQQNKPAERKLIQ